MKQIDARWRGKQGGEVVQLVADESQVEMPESVDHQPVVAALVQLIHAVEQGSGMENTHDALAAARAALDSVAPGWDTL